ncbi:MAG: hypothetical protein BWY32_03324 [bacterium ADurb.Bin243]|mgnify:CR=1 FL=1|nr:MAG: hypothetical protein BWY32_03324 [bacterium ADurb.Bin243]HOD40065.1 hypothetical protein [Candidatus Wallbacteria bacterium]
MSKHYISNSLVAKFMQRLQQKIESDGTVSKGEFNNLMQEVLNEHNNFFKG